MYRPVLQVDLPVDRSTCTCRTKYRYVGPPDVLALKLHWSRFPALAPHGAGSVQ